MITKLRPIYSLGVICGEVEYPIGGDLQRGMEKLARAHRFVHATEAAVKLGMSVGGG